VVVLILKVIVLVLVVLLVDVVVARPDCTGVVETGTGPGEREPFLFRLRPGWNQQCATDHVCPRSKEFPRGTGTPPACPRDIGLGGPRLPRPPQFFRRGGVPGATAGVVIVCYEIGCPTGTSGGTSPRPRADDSGGRRPDGRPEVFSS